MKIKISFVEEERAIAADVEAAIQSVLNSPRVKRVDTGETFKQTYLTTKLPEKL